MESSRYTLRGLHEGEVDHWLDHLEAAFAAKGTPRTYFANHFHRDPHRSTDQIRVSIDNDDHDRHGGIVSSIRVFERVTEICGKTVVIGGIGDVATRDTCRGAGLAGRLLAECEDWMKGRGIPLGVLHSSVPKIADFYRKHGWRTIPLNYFVAQLAQDVLTSSTPAPLTEDISIEEVSSCPPDTVIAELQQLHATFIAQYSGSFHRSADYWKQWVFEGECGLAARTTVHVARVDSTPIAYLIVRSRPTAVPAKLYIQEWVSLDQFSHEITLQALFQALLQQALIAHSNHQWLSPGCEVQFPVAMLDPKWVEPFINLPTAQHRIDEGYLYKIVDSSQLAQTLPTLASVPQDDASLAQELHRLMIEGLPSKPWCQSAHLFLGLDSY